MHAVVYMIYSRFPNNNFAEWFFPGQDDSRKDDSPEHHFPTKDHHFPRKMIPQQHLPSLVILPDLDSIFG